MKWEDREESGNVEDRRGLSPTTLAFGGGGLLIVLVAALLGVNPQKLAGLFGPKAPQRQVARDPEEERLARFTKVIFGDTERVWGKLFDQKIGRAYKKPTLVLFTDRVDSACGSADSAVGPFYCPADHRVYIDLTFYRDMETKLKAGGEFARAYVIAHEVGHHVQNLLGYNARAHNEGKKNSTLANQMSVRLELQADYLAGVWAHHADKEFRFIEPGDVEKALNAAWQIGDDVLQKRARGRVIPEKFTHGTGKQRVKWFKEGLETGDISKKKLDHFFLVPYGDL